MTRYEFFCEQFDELSDDDKVALYNEYAREHCGDDEIFEFDEEFFNTFFENKPMDAVRSVHFGHIESWNDPYIRFNGYANLESMSSFEAAEWTSDYKQQIYDYCDFDSYIDMDDWDYKEHFTEIIESADVECDDEEIERFVYEELTEDDDDSKIVEQFKEWLKDNREEVED